MRALLLLAAALVLAVCGTQARRVNDLERLVAKEQLMELHWYYNTNMDDAAALRSIYPATNPQFLQRVENIRSVFCPDSDFQGWTATGGVNGAVSMQTRYRDVLDPQAIPAANGPQSVTSIYRDVLPLIFGNSSQHFVGMPIITLSYGADNRLYAEFNATLRQVVNINFPPNPAMITDIMGHYNNKFVLVDPPGQGRENAYWCMRQFNAFNAFSVTHLVGTTFLAEQNANNNQLSAFTRPEPSN